MRLKADKVKGKKQTVLTIKDSNLLLTHSLKNLAKSFEVPIQKGVFPYTFIEEDKLNNIGLKPDIKYFC